MSIVDELGLTSWSTIPPRRGPENIKKMMTEFREAFPDLNFWAVGNLIAEGHYVVGR